MSGRRDDSLIEEIERDALDESVPLAAALRKCVVLGGKSGSEDCATGPRASSRARA
jgi:hypothetical protein